MRVAATDAAQAIARNDGTRLGVLHLRVRPVELLDDLYPGNPVAFLFECPAVHRLPKGMGRDGDPAALFHDAHDLSVIEPSVGEIDIAQTLAGDPIQQDVPEVAVDFHPLEDLDAVPV